MHAHRKDTVHGARRLGELENARVRLRILDAAAFTATFAANDMFCLDSTGGDTVLAKDNPWQYYEPEHQCAVLSASATLFKQTRYVNGQLNSGGNLFKNDVIGWEITFTNTTGDTLTNVMLSDARDTTKLALVEPGAEATCPFADYNGNLPGPAYVAGSITGSGGASAT